MKSTKKVDWGTAPEGATHYNVGCCYPWLKETPASYFADGAWIEHSDSTHMLAMSNLRNAVKRPQEWDGSGIPPVGTVCEYSLNDDVWFNCKITYKLSGTDDCFVAWCDHLGMDQFFSLSTDRYKLQLRKIKTPEQIEEEKRLQAIDEMTGLVEQYRWYKDAMSILYDAGYRKVDVKK